MKFLKRVKTIRTGITFLLLLFVAYWFVPGNCVFGAENQSTGAVKGNGQKEVRFYVRLDGNQQYENGSTHYDSSLYSPGITGKLAALKQINAVADGDDYLQKIKNNFVSEPSVDSFDIGGKHYSSSEYEIVWYVIKEEIVYWHVDGILKKKTEAVYNVKFCDYDKKVLSVQTVVEGGSVAEEKGPERKAETGKRKDGSSYLNQYSFAKWVPEDTSYCLKDISNVRCNMVFDADYTMKNVPVTYYIRLDGREPVENGNTQYEAGSYSDGIKGELYGFQAINQTAFPSDYKEKIKKTVCKAPAAEDFHINGSTYSNKDYDISWYVIKEDTNGWRVDGILVKKSDKDTSGAAITPSSNTADSVTAMAQQKGTTVKTGDTQKWEIWLTLMCIAILALAGMMWKRHLKTK